MECWGRGGGGGLEVFDVVAEREYPHVSASLDFGNVALLRLQNICHAVLRQVQLPAQLPQGQLLLNNPRVTLLLAYNNSGVTIHL